MAKRSSEDELLVTKAQYLYEYAQRAYAHSVDQYAGAAETLERANAEIAESINRKGSRLSRAYIATVALVSAISLAFLLATIREVLPGSVV